MLLVADHILNKAAHELIIMGDASRKIATLQHRNFNAVESSTPLLSIFVVMFIRLAVIMHAH